MANYSLDKAITDVHASIENAIKAEMFLPTAILIYSAIDAAAWLSCEDEEHTSKHFINWVDRWMVPQKKLLCTATELYAARCGILHTYTSKTRLTRNGKAREICYVNGRSTVKEMEDILIRGNNDLKKYVAVRLDDIYETYKPRPQN